MAPEKNPVVFRITGGQHTRPWGQEERKEVWMEYRRGFEGVRSAERKRN